MESLGKWRSSLHPPVFSSECLRWLYSQRLDLKWRELKLMLCLPQVSGDLLYTLLFSSECLLISLFLELIRAQTTAILALLRQKKNFRTPMLTPLVSKETIVQQQDHPEMSGILPIYCSDQLNGACHPLATATRCHHSHIYTCTCTHTYKHIYTYIHTCIYMYIHLHRHANTIATERNFGALEGMHRDEQIRVYGKAQLKEW
jgi:hypothetical protein